MWKRFDLLGRNRRVIALFVLMVLLPALIFSVLIVRAIRSERVRLDYETSQRQRQIIRLLDADFHNWLFSSGVQSARAQARLRFEVDSDRINFPDHDLSLPVAESPDRRPFDATPTGVPLTRDLVARLYYPRIQVFLRDLHAGRHNGAQHFLRLRALVVRPPGGNDGYVIDSDRVLDYVNRRLAEFCSGEPFVGRAGIADGGATRRPAGEIYGLQNLAFFEVGFDETDTRSAMGPHAFSYVISLLVAITVLGSIFLYRAVTHEVRLSQLRNEFVAAVSHEFRSPLSSILALIERLNSSRAPDPAKVREYHEIIDRDARRLSVLVARLLDFAQIEEGKKQYSLEPVDLVASVREAIAASRSVPDSGRIRMSAPTQAAMWVHADRAALHHSIQNLIENAAKYSPVESPIDVRCACDNGWHVVEVRDRGMGIPSPELDRIFEKFYRGRHVRELNVQGVGIGLALVRHVMDSHGGSVTVESEVGRGSRFCLRFPRMEI